MSGPVSFRLPETLTGDELERRLAAEFTTSPSPVTKETKTFHDSFDWRIHQGGGTYETTGDGEDRVHVWRDGDGRVRHRLEFAGEPAFPADLPAAPPADLTGGALRDELGPVLSMRRLLALVAVDSTLRVVAVLDKERKTTVRVQIEDEQSREPEGKNRHALPTRVTVVPVRGYDKARDRVIRFLTKKCGLTPDHTKTLVHLLEPFGRSPGDYSSKFRLKLDPAMTAGQAARAIHEDLLTTMLRNEDGVRRDLDSEFLHDFRVSVRRTRSALTQIRGVYPETVVERFKEEFRWLGTVTGPLRDLDVYLLKMDSYKSELPEDTRADLDPLGDFLRQRQKEAHGHLVGALNSKRYSRLVDEWRAFLAAPSTGEPENGNRPVRAVASERIWSVYRRIVKRGLAIDDDTPAEALHDIRIRGKKLRYLLEFFRSLYPEETIVRLVSELKRLQDNLGDFNDYEVQRANLREYAGEMARDGGTPVETHLAMGRLLDRLDAGQDRELRRFAKRFERFASAENRAEFRQLFSRGDRS